MPGIMTPAGAPPLEIAVPSDSTPQIRPQSQHSNHPNPRNRSSPLSKKTPSPSSSSTFKKRNSPSTPSEKSRPPLIDESALDNPDLGPFLLKLARDTIASGESPIKALEYAIRASKSFERFEEMRLDLAMSLHVTAAIYCSLGKYEEAVPVLERAVAVVGEMEGGGGAEHALARFSGCMQLGDTYSMLGKVDQSIECYTKGLQIQMEALGEMDPRVAETCR